MARGLSKPYPTGDWKPRDLMTTKLCYKPMASKLDRGAQLQRRFAPSLKHMFTRSLLSQ